MEGKYDRERKRLERKHRAFVGREERKEKQEVAHKVHMAKARKNAPVVTVIIGPAIQRRIGQRLMVLYQGKMTDATVVAVDEPECRPARHRLVLTSGAEIELDLNEFNHCAQRLESAEAYEAARARRRDRTEAAHRHPPLPPKSTANRARFSSPTCHPAQTPRASRWTGPK